MPTVIKRTWRATGAFSRRDPTLFVASFAVWMLLTGLSLLAPGKAFETVITYRIAAELGVNEDVAGAIMVANGVLLFWALGPRTPQTRAMLAYMSGALWVFWGLMQLFSGLRYGLISAPAVWSIFASFSLINAAWPLSGGMPDVAARPPLPPSPRPFDKIPPTLRESV